MTDALLRALLAHYYGEPVDAPTKDTVEGVVEMALTDLRALCDKRGISHHQVDGRAYLAYAQSVADRPRQTS